ncbi:uncharacterized protein LOC124890947 [Capsicum annuum]|uniref:uncharacterized protein LOC124890947 n=1 Tax=Capsicum annuum TaxID=4072 RepID=UPI001FB16A6A|nr:uncharacterized protein LOC124890947 [Capsicum annuum]
MAEQEEADRLAALARAQVNVQSQGQQVRHPNHDDEDFGDKELLNPQNPRSGKISPGLSIGKSVDGEVVVDKSKESKLVEPKKLDSSIDALEREKTEERGVVLKSIPRPPPPFPQRFKKKSYNAKFSKFMEMLKQLAINMPLVEALEQMPGYAKFIKDLMTKK